MKCPAVSVLLLILSVDSGFSTENRFFISAPNVFHVGVNEKVTVQMGGRYLNIPVTLYLVHSSSGTRVSGTKTVTCVTEKDMQTAELMIDSRVLSTLPLPEHGPEYLMLVAESRSFGFRNLTKVLISKHRGYIFIQTNQPAYNPTQAVSYRIFTLDHTLRPCEEVLKISVFNAVGNRVMTSFKTAQGGIFRDAFFIPDISETGTWKIKAHYDGDEENAVSREFKVQKFVLPSFEVNIEMEQKYILLDDKQIVFTVSSMYVHGEKVNGSYHCKFGVEPKNRNSGKKIQPVFIKGLELTGSVQLGISTVSLDTKKINEHLQKEMKRSLSDLQQSGEKLYLGVFVINIKSGEIQEGEVSLPVLSQKYTVDLSRTRSHLPPGFPLDVVVIVRLPDRSPATGVRVRIETRGPLTQFHEGNTDREGALFHTFNIDATAQTTVDVTAEGVQQSKVIKRPSSPGDSFLHISFHSKVYSVNDLFTVTYNTKNGPTDGFIYYMIRSRGVLVKNGSLPFGGLVKDNVYITADMVPSFRLIGYFYNQQGDIVADSLWVDVRDECEAKVKVETEGHFIPGKKTTIKLNLHGGRAKVALLAVDKAFYALNADNRLTAKQVFTAMESYDLGCSYGGGADPASVLGDAGLAFVTHSEAGWRKAFHCDSPSARQKRSMDLQEEMNTMKSNFTDELLQECCTHGFSLIPMTLTCQTRAERVSLVGHNQACTDAFLKCCLEGESLRQEKMEEVAARGLGRTTSDAVIEQFFMDTQQYIRRLFPPSFAFIEFDVNGNHRLEPALPDSITTWEFQIITISAESGFCVVQPLDVTAAKDTFVSLRLPYSVKKYEQISISPVIYNYGEKDLNMAVHMEQTEGLCSPGSPTTTAFVRITVEAKSSKFVSFSAVPMVTGSIPIKIRLYDIENERGLDAIEKTLNVRDEGLEKREELTKVVKLEGRSSEILTIDGALPDEVVPGSSSNIFISAGESGIYAQTKYNLSPGTVAQLIGLPTGCLEQTTSKLAITASALRYLDLSQQWFDLPANARDDAFANVMKGYMRINELYKNKDDGSYAAWKSAPPSNWVTALVVKVFSLVAQRQSGALLRQETQVVPQNEIMHSVSYLLSVQRTDGSFIDPYPVLHRGVLTGKDQEAFLTAFITVSLQVSLPFLKTEVKAATEASISRSTTFLMSHLDKLKHPYAVALTAYCLSICLPEETDSTSVWSKLQASHTKGKNGCYLWTDDPSESNKENADAITVEATAYALLTALALKKADVAKKTVCWLITQQTYSGGFKSSQDTVVALEALAEYELQRTVISNPNLRAEFSSPSKKDIIKFELENTREKVETDLKKFTGNNISMQLSGEGHFTIKIVKAYQIMAPKDDCTKLSISVTVEGKVKYTAKVIETYEHYDDYDDVEDNGPPSANKQVDAPVRTRRDADGDQNSDSVVTYRVCVSHGLKNTLTGMGIADITLLSGFEAAIEHLDRLKQSSEQYISHYEVSYGRVILYFNELFKPSTCIQFDAVQMVAIGLLQPAPAVFYDYYEPSQRCTVFYSPPKRSKLVSKLCSESVCQCAERPCHKISMTFQSGRRMNTDYRFRHACFFPTVDYAYIVEVFNVSTKINFEMFQTKVIEVLRSNGDQFVVENSVRVFAVRHHCKGELNLGKTYLIMGKDGSTKDSNGEMQYLLESNTWVEKKPTEEECKKSAHQAACKRFSVFVNDYKMNGCNQ